MDDKDRGKIRNREYAKQLKDFSGLRFGKITPTDIDGFCDFGKEDVFVFIETKHGDAPLPTGQRLALEALCDTCEKGGKTSIVLIGHHHGDGDIDVGGLDVTTYRMRRKWHKPRKILSIRQAVEQILKGVH